MKALKITIVALVLITGMASCKKSEVKPATCPSGNTSTAASTAKSTDTDSQMYYGREALSEGDNEDPGITNIYGSGDDDRNGGDKTRKKTK